MTVPPHDSAAIPSVRRIVRVDPWACSLAAVAGLVGLVLALILPNVMLKVAGLKPAGREPEEVVLAFALIAAGVCLVLVACVWRVRKIRRLFRVGDRLPAVISRVLEVENLPVAVEYRYSLFGSPREGKVRAPNPKLIRPNPLEGFVEGRKVTVVVESSAPAMTLVADLYEQIPEKNPT